jgi:cobaltochelatase CobN
VLGVLRAQQTWGGEAGLAARPAAALGAAYDLVEDDRVQADRLEEMARALVLAVDAADWSADAVDGIVREQLDRELPDVSRVLRFACEEVVPRLAGTTAEIDNLLHGLSGGFVPAGPSGSPTRGLVGVLPTGRNFYSVDPKAIPSRNAWAVGVSLGDSLLSRYLADHGEYPSSVGLVVWGTSPCAPPATTSPRRSGCSASARSGTRPPGASSDLEVVPAAELGRPRVDVTLRISGFFRDAFPHVVQLLDDAVQLVAGLDEADNFLRATCRPTSRSAPTSGGPPPRSSAASPGRTAPACCRSSTAATGRPTPTWPRSGRSGAATRTARAWTGAPRAATWSASTRA